MESKFKDRTYFQYLFLIWYSREKLIASQGFIYISWIVFIQILS